MEPKNIVKIVEAAKLYVATHNLTQSEMATRADINAAYLNQMLLGKTVVGQTTIGDGYWRKLAAAIALPLTDEVQWPIVKTEQLLRLVSTLEVCRKQKAVKTIIGAPGVGKSYVIEQYSVRYPKHTYVVILNDLLTMNEIQADILRQLGLPTNGSSAMRFYNIVMKLRDIANNGENAILIFDEGENIRSQTMKMLKSFFDRLNGVVSIVLVGTDHLFRKMKDFKDKSKDAAPQFYRRFANVVWLDEVDRKFTAFYEATGITDKGLKKLLNDLCEDYGMLKNYLYPVMQEASEMGLPLNEELFRKVHNLPKLR